MSVPDGPSRTQDEWIALRCQAGDNTGFEDLVALMERPLLYYAAKLTGNGQTAYDVLQDVWVKVSLHTSFIFKLKSSAALKSTPASEAVNPASWIWRPSFERQRDFNPPEQRAAQRALPNCRRLGPSSYEKTSVS